LSSSPPAESRLSGTIWIAPSRTINATDEIPAKYASQISRGR
jgi:hypothetical protein